MGSSEEASLSWLGDGCAHLETCPYGPVTHVVATEQAEGVVAGTRRQRDPGEPDSRCWPRDSQPLPGCEQTAAGVKSPAAGHGWAFLPHRDSEEDAEPSCAREGCLASRVASCSCELLTEGRWAQSRLEQWRAGLEAAVAPRWPDTHTFLTCRFSSSGPAPAPRDNGSRGDSPTQPRSRGCRRRILGLRPVGDLPGDAGIPGRQWQQQHRCSGALPFLPPSRGPAQPTGPSQALPEPPKL